MKLSNHIMNPSGVSPESPFIGPFTAVRSARPKVNSRRVFHGAFTEVSAEAPDTFHIKSVVVSPQNKELPKSCS